MLRPTPSARRTRSGPAKLTALGKAAAPLGHEVTRTQINVTFTDPERGRRRAARVHPLRRLRVRLQRRGEEHHAHELPPRRGHHGAQIFTEVAVRHLARAGRPVGGAHRPLGPGASVRRPRPVRHRRRRRAGRGQAGHHRDPAALAPSGACRSRTRSASASPATATCSASATTATTRSTASGRATGRRAGQAGGPTHHGRDRRARATTSRTATSSRRAPSPAALASACRPLSPRRRCRRCTTTRRPAARPAAASHGVSLGGGSARCRRPDLTYLVMSHDDASGGSQLEDDRRADRLAWRRASADVTRRRRAAHASDRRARRPVRPRTRCGASRSGEPDHRAPAGRLPHGRAAEAGVVDHRGRVFSGPRATRVHDGLYVMDGSVIPRRSGVNPLLTISALAERSCALLAPDRGWTVDDTLADEPLVLAAARCRHPVHREDARLDPPARTDPAPDDTDASFTLTIEIDDVRRAATDRGDRPGPSGRCRPRPSIPSR